MVMYDHSIDMPTFSMYQCLTWDSDYASSVWVSPQPWLIESLMMSCPYFTIQKSADIVNGQQPPWRMIVGKWHLKQQTRLGYNYVEKLINHLYSRD